MRNNQSPPSRAELKTPLLFHCRRPHLCCSAHKKKCALGNCVISRTTGSPSTSDFSLCRTFRHFATTPAVESTPTCPALQNTLRCAQFSVAKRQQIPCTLGGTTSSLKVENVVRGSCCSTIVNSLYLCSIFLENENTSTLRVLAYSRK